MLLLPVPLVAFMLNFAWFQYGLGGPSFTRQIPGTYLQSPFGAIAVGIAAVALFGWIFAGFRVLTVGSRRWLAGYLGASLFVVVALLLVGSRTVTSVT